MIACDHECINNTLIDRYTQIIASNYWKIYSFINNIYKNMDNQNNVKAWVFENGVRIQNYISSILKTSKSFNRIH